MYPSANQTAAVIAAMLKRSGQSRARLSTATIKKIARRKSLRSTFVVYLSDALADSYDWQIIELASGGFGAIQGKALEAAKAVTGNRYLSETERKMLVRGTADYEEYHREAVVDAEEGEEEDE